MKSLCSTNIYFKKYIVDTIEKASWSRCTNSPIPSNVAVAFGCPPVNNIVPLQFCMYKFKWLYRKSINSMHLVRQGNWKVLILGFQNFKVFFLKKNHKIAICIKVWYFWFLIRSYGLNSYTFQCLPTSK